MNNSTLAWTAGALGLGYLLFRPRHATAATTGSSSGERSESQSTSSGMTEAEMTRLATFGFLDGAGGASAAPPSPVAPPAPASSTSAPAPMGLLRNYGALPGRWVMPLPRYQGRAPVISDGFGSPRPGTTHQGVDLMFARANGDPWTPGTPNGTKGFVMPPGTLVVSAGDGVLYSATQSPRGFCVVIDHGAELGAATFYQHMEHLLVPITFPQRGAQRMPIKAGQPLGIVGGDPLNRSVNHLHFELWAPGPRDAIDPRRFVAQWPSLDASELRNAVGEDGLVHVPAYKRNPQVQAYDRNPNVPAYTRSPHVASYTRSPEVHGYTRRPHALNWQS